MDLWWGDFCIPPEADDPWGFEGVSKIMLARKLSSMLPPPPPGVSLSRRETGAVPGEGG